MIHGLPERHALNAVVTKVHERDGYRIENVMFQSRPNFWVTGNLYVPTRGEGPFPAVISPCGHYALARMDPEYQFAYLNMVHSGFVVLAYDPIGQGERRQYWNPQTGHADIPDSTSEHSMPVQVGTQTSAAVSLFAREGPSTSGYNRQGQTCHDLQR